MDTTALITLVGLHLGTAVAILIWIFWMLGGKVKKKFSEMTNIIYIILFFSVCGFTHLINPPLNWGGVGGSALSIFCTWWLPRTLILFRRKRKAEAEEKAKVPEAPQPKALNLPNTFYDAATGMLHVTKGTELLPEGSTIQLTAPNPADAYRATTVPAAPSHNEPVLVPVACKGAPGMETHITVEELAEEQPKVPGKDSSFPAQLRRYQESQRRKGQQDLHAMSSRDYQSGDPDPWVSSTGPLPDGDGTTGGNYQ